MEKSKLLEKEEEIEQIKYSSDEEKYVKSLMKRLEIARNNRDMPRDEFDQMDYQTYYELNERLANTFIGKKLNKEDSNFQSGIIRQKLFAFLSSIVSLDLAADISVYDKNEMELQGLGDAMEDIIFKTNELDQDEEKKLLRQYELLKHGTVFIEEIWDSKKQKDKKTKGIFNGKINSVKWTTKIKKAFKRPIRNIIPNVNVYLGDITKYDISEQPYIFTVDIIPYSEAEALFKSWDRWENVNKKLSISNETNNFLNWRLLSNKNDYVEIIRYQDKYENEFALLLNGTLMTPVGLPIEAATGFDSEYNIVQQNLEPINSKFAYGKSFLPPYINISGRVLSNKVLMPGKISYGIQPGTLVPINDKETQGVSQSELAMINEIQKSIDSETVSPTFQGQQSERITTATEIIEMQKQAKQIVGLTIFAASMLEWKLNWLRLLNLIKNWFNKEDEVVDEIRNIIHSKFRTISVDKMIENEGMGRKIIIPTENIPSSQSIMEAEDILSKEQNMPIRLNLISAKEIKNSKLIWQIVIKVKEKKTSDVNKLLFRAEMQDATIFGDGLNLEYMQEKFASVWNENPKKMFKSINNIETKQMSNSGIS